MEDCRPKSAYRGVAPTLTEFSWCANWSLSAEPGYPCDALGCRHDINPRRLSRAATSYRYDVVMMIECRLTLRVLTGACDCRPQWTKPAYFAGIESNLPDDSS